MKTIRFLGLLVIAAIAMPLAQHVNAQVILSDSFNRTTGMFGDPGPPPVVGDSDWGSFDNNAGGGTALPTPYLTTGDDGTSQEQTTGEFGFIPIGRTILDYNLGTDAQILAAGGFRVTVDLQPSNIGGGGFQGRDWLGLLLTDSNNTQVIGGQAATFNLNNSDVRVGAAPRNSGSVLTRLDNVLFGDGKPDPNIAEDIFDQNAFDNYVTLFNSDDGSPGEDPTPEFVDDSWYTMRLDVRKAAGTAEIFDADAAHTVELYIGPQGGELQRMDFDISTPGVLEDAFSWGDNNPETGLGNPDPTPGEKDAYIAFVGNGGFTVDESEPPNITSGHYFDNLKLEVLSSTNADPADLNGDGFVDGLDLGILLGNFDQTAAPSGGELNGTDPVDGLDLGILLGAWNPPALIGGVTVPEPSSLLLISVAGLGFLWRGRA